jgi:hypothetical protein
LSGPDLGNQPAIKLFQIREQALRRFQVDRIEALSELCEYRLQKSVGAIAFAAIG